jgi:hypothetical protein
MSVSIIVISSACRPIQKYRKRRLKGREGSGRRQADRDRQSADHGGGAGGYRRRRLANPTTETVPRASQNSSYRIRRATRRPPLDCRRMVRPAANVSGQAFSTGSRARQEALRGACARFLTIVPPIVVAFILLGFRLAKNASCVSLGQQYIFFD